MIRSLLVLSLLLATAGCDATFRFDQERADAGHSTDAGMDAGVDAGGDAGTDAGPAPTPCLNSASCKGLRCDRTAGICVQCTDDDDCPIAKPRCDTTQHVCVECIATTDCGTSQVCEPNTHRCIDACSAAATTCETGFFCAISVGICIECTTNASCAAAAGGAICDPSIGRCVECTANTDCSGGAAVCDRRSGRCAACVSSIPCGVGNVCDPTTLVCHAL